MIMISDRPAEVADRAVPDHWEGDLIVGQGGRSAIGTVVERRSRYVVLVHLPNGRTAEHMRLALTRQLAKLPADLRRTLTWDQGKEMAEHVRFTIDTDIDVYFCDPHSPWQRGSSENTNGLLRQYFPRGANLSAYTRRSRRGSQAAQRSPSTNVGMDETLRDVQPRCCVDHVRAPFHLRTLTCRSSRA
jgi:IS30 family transposase